MIYIFVMELEALEAKRLRLARGGQRTEIWTKKHKLYWSFSQDYVDRSTNRKSPIILCITRQFFFSKLKCIQIMQLLYLVQFDAKKR